MPVAGSRNSDMRAMSRGMASSLLRRLRRLRLRIWKNLSNCSQGLVIHQASVPHQCNHWPDVGLQIKTGDSVCQKIDSQADRLNARDGSGGARQCWPVRCVGDAQGQLDDEAILVIGLKDRIIFEAANRSVVCVISDSTPSRMPSSA